MKKLLVLFTAVALVAFALPAMSADWNFYGSARMQTTYISDNYKDTLGANGTDDKDSETLWNLQGNTRFGARVKGDGGLGGRMEFGVNESSITSRLLFGTWKFGAGSLKVGKDYTPGASQFISSSIQTGRVGASGDDQNILGLGTLYGSRVGQVELSLGGFRIALLDSATNLPSGLAATNGDVDSYLPKIQADFGMAMDNFTFNIGGGYNYFKVENVTPTVGTGTDDVKVTSYFLSGMGTAGFGPFTLKAALSYGENWDQAGWNAGIAGSTAVWDGTDDVEDTTTFMGALVGVFKMSDMWQFEGGFGYRQDKWDANVANDKLKRYQGYLQALVWLAPGVALMPEVGYIDWGDNTSDSDQGNTMYVGAKWQIDF